MNSATLTQRVTKTQDSSLSHSLVLSKPIPEQPPQFFPALAHEIRNPLSNINLATEMLKTIVMDDFQKTYLDIILRSSAKINNIVTGSLTSLQAGELQPQKHSIHQLLDETLAVAGDRLILKNITVRKEYAAKNDKMLVNASKMKIALTNIIINAIEAMPPENGELKLVTKSMNGKCVVEIGDNGAGISTEDLKSIFKPFFTNKPGGMGLGLSTTKDILHSDNVGMKVWSKKGEGTRFILLFRKESVSLPSVRNRSGFSHKIVLVPKGDWV